MLKVLRKMLVRYRKCKRNKVKKISEAQSIIKQHSDQIDLTIKKKDMEDYVGGLGSINEVRNAGLNTTKFWNLSAGTVLQPNSIYKGYPTFWSDYSGKTSDHWSGAISDFISVTTGESLVSTGWFATDNIASLDQKSVDGNRILQWDKKHKNENATCRNKMD